VPNSILERVLFSCIVTHNTSYFAMLNKKRKLVVTTERVLQLANKSDNEIREKEFLKDLEGISKSLL